MSDAAVLRSETLSADVRPFSLGSAHSNSHTVEYGAIEIGFPPTDVVRRVMTTMKRVDSSRCRVRIREASPSHTALTLASDHDF